MNITEKEKVLSKELEEMFSRENEEQDKSHVKTAENHEEIMEMIEDVEKKNGKLTDKQWVIATEKIMPHLDALIKISEELGTGFSIIVNLDGASDVSCYKNNYGMYIHLDGTCSIRKNFRETIKEFPKKRPDQRHKDQGKEKYPVKL